MQRRKNAGKIKRFFFIKKTNDSQGKLKEGKGVGTEKSI